MLGSRMPSVGAVVLLVAALAYLLFAGEDDGGGSRARPEDTTVAVTSVVDGDTIHATIDGEDESVRYIGIDTPESVAPDQPVECFGHAATRRNERLVRGERVHLVFGAEPRDRYGRLLAYVYVGERLINAELVEGGFATTLEIPPNTDEAPLLNRLERRAAADGRGLWGAC